MAKAPTPGKTTGRKPINVGFSGQTWPLRTSEITPRDVADLRRSTGFGTREVLTALAESGLDLDLAAGLIFLARRQVENPAITFEEATAGFTYGTRFEYGLANDEDTDTPEA